MRVVRGPGLNSGGRTVDSMIVALRQGGQVPSLGDSAHPSASPGAGTPGGHGIPPDAGVASVILWLKWPNMPAGATPVAG